MLDQISLSQGCLSNLKKNAMQTIQHAIKKIHIHVEIIKKISKFTERKRKLYRKIVSQIRQK